MSSDICKRVLCIKNLFNYSDKTIDNLFGSFGKISHKVIPSGETNKKDIIVEFESEELATKARNAVHGKVIDGCNLFVDYAVSTPPSLTSPSMKNNLKPKISVLDRIIKPGDPKYPKYDEKGFAVDKLIIEKEHPSSDNNYHAASQFSKVLQHKTDKYDSFDQPSQLHIVKKSDFVDKGQDNNGNHDVGSKYESSHSKKSFTTQTQERMSQRIYTDGPKRLEIIKPRRDDNNLLIHSNQKESNSVMKNLQITPDSINLRLDDQRSYDNSGKEVLNEIPYKDSPYYPSKQKKNEKSRSRSRDKSRNSRSSHYSNYNSNQRKSPSRSFSKDRLDIQRKNNDHNSHNRNYQSHHSIVSDRSNFNNKDLYYDKHSSQRHQDSDLRNKRSRSRSSHGREFSPYRDQRERRDDPGYDYSRKRSPSRSRSRERSKSRNRYDKSSYRSSRSRSSERNRHSINIDKNRKNKPRKVITGGLVIEKRDSAQKYDDYNRNYKPDYKDYRYDYSKDRYRRSSRSRERSHQNDWRHSSGYYKKDLDVEKNANRSRMSVAKYGHEDRDKIHQENKEQQPLYNNIYIYNPQPVFESNFSNPTESLQNPTNNISEQYLPSYLSTLNTQNPAHLPLVTPGSFAFSEPIQSQILQANNVYKIQLSNQAKESFLSQNIDEEIEASHAEISLTENTNDTAKTEDKGSPDKREIGLDMEIDEGNNEPNHPLASELIKNKKMQSIINYLVKTNDLQGLKEKLNAVGKQK